MQFALLNVSADYDDAPRNFRREFDVPLVEYDVPAGELPDESAVDAAVITGSWASVYWDLDWIAPLREWTRDAVKDELPLLGVCFGHQLLADVLGGEVAGRTKYELGFHNLVRAEDSILFDGVPRLFIAFTSHSDDVVSLPLGARLLGENEYSIHAFRKNRAFGVQFHAEADMKTAKRFVREREPSEERTPDAVGTLTEAKFEEAKKTKQIFDNFTRYVERLQ